MKFIRKVARFVTEVAQSAYRHVRDWVRGVLTHSEAIILLVLAGIGISALVSEIPFLVASPIWLEGQMVIPVISTFIVAGLVWLSVWRANRRMSHAVNA